MADREKLKARFEELKASMEVGLFGTVGMDEVEAVLELIRETEPRVQDEGVTPIESKTEQKKFADRIGFSVSEYWCGECHFNLVSRPKFCPNCGKAVKWDEEPEDPAGTKKGGEKGKGENNDGTDQV